MLSPEPVRKVLTEVDEAVYQAGLMTDSEPAYLAIQALARAIGALTVLMGEPIVQREWASRMVTR